MSRMHSIILTLALITGMPLAQARSESVPLPTKSPVSEQKRAALVASFGTPALAYLAEKTGKSDTYLAPSDIDPRFTLAFYVNANGSGAMAQRMWVLQRDRLGGPWRLGLWDEAYWRRKGLPEGITPPYSWPVSTGRAYRGDRKSGPTPGGVFGIDERPFRLDRGYHAPGMINVVYIDFHYTSGRRSGVAFHGTTPGRYRRLGSIDSHGCIRMTQANALALLDRLQGRDGVLSKDLWWGSVPRFWSHERHGARFGYTRDGTMRPLEGEAVAETETRVSSLVGAVTLPPAFTPVLTKDGYRAIAIIFRD